MKQITSRIVIIFLILRLRYCDVFLCDKRFIRIYLSRNVNIEAFGNMGYIYEHLSKLRLSYQRILHDQRSNCVELASGIPCQGGNWTNLPVKMYRKLERELNRNAEFIECATRNNDKIIIKVHIKLPFINTNLYWYVHNTTDPILTQRILLIRA